MLTTISQAAGPADLYLLHIYLMKKDQKEDSNMTLLSALLNLIPFLQLLKPQIAHFSLRDSLTLLRIYSTSQISAIIQFHHYSQFLCLRPTSKHYMQEAQDRSSRNSTSRSSLSKCSISFFVSACHPPDF